MLQLWWFMMYTFDILGETIRPAALSAVSPPTQNSIQIGIFMHNPQPSLAALDAVRTHNAVQCL